MEFGESIPQSVSNGVHYSASRRSSENKESTFLPPMESQNWLMHAYYTRGEVDKAKRVIGDELHRSNGRNEYAHYLMGTIYADEEKLTEALKELQICNKLNPANIDYIKLIAKCLFRQKRHKMALEALMEAENLSKKLDWEIHYWIAECLIMLGSRDSALQWSQRAARAGKTPLACRQLALLLAKAGDVAAAAQACSQALQNAPDDAELLTTLGLLHAKADQQQLAVERLGSALALGPPQARALLPLAAIMQSHRDYDVALSRYKIAAQQTPDCAAMWNNIGMCFFGKQKIIAAMSCLKRAVALSPLSARVLHNLGLVHLTADQAASAFQFLCAAVNLRPGNATTFTLMAITLTKLQDFGNALKAHEEALALAPEDAAVRINYCVFLADQKQLEQARHHLSVTEDIAAKHQIKDPEFLDILMKLKESLVISGSSRDARSPKPDRDMPRDDVKEHTHGGRPPASISVEEAMDSPDLDEDEV